MDNASSSPLEPDQKKGDEPLPVLSELVELEGGDEFDHAVPMRAFQEIPLVGLGGSAGSIGALQKFFETMPAESGMAFVVILHLSPEHESTLPELLQHATSMPVRKAQNGVKVEANQVYVIPPGKHLISVDGYLRLVDLAAEPGRRLAVDVFFRTLADSHGPRSVAIVLSGADGDGALGIKRVKERGGLTIAQDPAEAEHASMPRTAIDTGMVDWVLEVAEMPARLMDYLATARRLRLPPEDGPQPAEAEESSPTDDERALREVLTFVRTRTGRDFSYYKRATIVRRISRRMQVNGMTTLPDYLSFLRTHPGEAGALLQDLLISVTNFFRDRDSFAELEKQLAELFAGKNSSDTIRVWVPACATGEEAYSIGMLLLERAATFNDPPAVQIFATDLDETVIATARNALYPATIAADVSEERLKRFFSKEHRGYRVRRELRECVLFAVHDLLKDAPFSRLHFISCRNLLIYFTREAQQRALEIFHFALRSYGLLFLGSSESIDEESRAFRLLSKKHRMFTQKPAPRIGLPVPIGPGTLARALEAQQRALASPKTHGEVFARAAAAAWQNDVAHSNLEAVSWEELHFRLIERFAPPSIIVNRDYEILHVSENAGRFLHFSGGEPSINLLKVVHPMLRIELRAALFRSAQGDVPVEVFRVPVELDQETQLVDVRISPAREIAPDCLLVVLSIRDLQAGEPAPMRLEAEPAVRHLEREIEQFKIRLRDTVEQYEASTEELKASNEELQAMNEELRSATEELETSREELQSINEELTTVNQELKSKVDQLDGSNSDLANLMSATAIATIFLDRSLRIMRYTPTAVALFRLIPSDLGRPLADLTHELDYPELIADAEDVLRTLLPRRREVRDSHGSWFLSQLLPYRTAEDYIGGMVLTLVDITETRAAEQAQRESEGIYRTLAANLPNGAAFVVDQDLRYLVAEGEALATAGMKKSDFEGRTLHEVWPAESAARWVAPYRRALAGKPFQEEHSENGRHYITHGTPLRNAAGAIYAVLAVSYDMTGRIAADRALHEGEKRFRIALEGAGMAAWDFDVGSQVVTGDTQYFRLLGLERTIQPHSPELFLGIVHPEDRAMLREQTRIAVEETGLHRAEFRIVRASDGAVRWMTGFGQTVEWRAHQSARLTGVMFDVTERREALETLARAEDRLRLILENAREYAILTMDLERRITSWNRGAEVILGYPQEEILGQLADVIFTSEDRALGVPRYEAETALREGRSADERWHLHQDGHQFWGSGVMMSMHGTGGQPIGLLKVFRDHTEARASQLKLEQALQEKEAARAESESANRAKDHFLAVLSHELRTPLTPVLMAVHTLARRTDLPPDLREALEMIKRNVQVEAHFIDDLLDVTKITHGKLEIVRETVDLHEAVHHAVEIARGDWQGKEQTLNVELRSQAPVVQGDFKRLQQVVWNLLKNASKFTSMGGHLSVSTWDEGEGVHLEIADSGIGIAQEALPTIFNAFTQADEAIAQQFGGLGLGLAIVKATIDAHGGTIHATSEGRARGAKFTVWLPRLLPS